MEASLRLRAKDYAAHDRWLVNLQDVITSNRLDDLWENQQVPTLEAVQRQFPQEKSAKQQELYATAMKQWQLENTQLYFLVKDSSGWGTVATRGRRLSPLHDSLRPAVAQSCKKLRL